MTNPRPVRAPSWRALDDLDPERRALQGLTGPPFFSAGDLSRAVRVRPPQRVVARRVAVGEMELLPPRHVVGLLGFLLLALVRPAFGSDLDPQRRPGGELA